MLAAGSLHMRRSRKQAGFTLVELAIVVVIVGILATIAYPSYQSQLMKSRRADAKNALLSAANRQEQYILDHGTYVTDMKKLGYAASPAISEDGYYSIAAAAGACGAIGRCYKLTATPVAGKPQAADSRCTSFVLESNGSRTATGTLGNECWE